MSPTQGAVPSTLNPFSYFQKYEIADVIRVQCELYRKVQYAGVRQYERVTGLAVTMTFLFLLYVAQSGLELIILLPQLLQCWVYRHSPLYIVTVACQSCSNFAKFFSF